MNKRIAVLIIALSACGGEQAPSEQGRWVQDNAREPTAHQPPGPTVQQLTSLASRAYIYGYPAVQHRDEMVQATSTDALLFSAPLDTFGSAERLGLPEDHPVSINEDALYHVLMGDVADEPLVLNVPATGGRYVVLQLVDAWTNNFAYLGTRATSGRAGKYLLTGPGWEGEVPEGITRIPIPTRHFAIVGRIAVDGPRDLSEAQRVQREIWVTPLSRYPERREDGSRELGDRELAPYDTEVSEELVFWEKLRTWIALDPPPESEADLLESFAPLGLTTAGAESPYRDPSPELRQALIDGAAGARQRIENLLDHAPHGWQLSTHWFDYNVDYLEIGTIDSQEWKMDDRAQAYVARAVAARIAPLRPHGYETVYAMRHRDEDGEELVGAHRYEITFETVPPVDAFWSLTMYDEPNHSLVDNEIHRFSITEHTRGLRRGRDDSLTIIMSHEAPPRAERANWLPAPEGQFRPMLRMYMPQEAILDGVWTLPSIRRVEGDDGGVEGASAGG